MGKTSKWIINLLTGKKEENKVKKQSKIIGSNPQIISVTCYNPTTLVSIPPATTPREKRLWSFCRRRDSIFATATTTAAPGRASAVEAGAATKIQSVFRAHLARRALKALKGLVKLQALVRGHLVRKQAIATLRCMESLMTAQTRVRSKRLHMAEDANNSILFALGKSTHEEDIIRSLNQDYDIGPQKNIKIKEMNISNHKPAIKSINIYSNSCTQFNKTEHIKISTHISPPSSSSVITTADHMSPRTSSNHFDRYSFSPTTLIGPFPYPRSEQGESSSSYNNCYNQLYLSPNYMADTESSRAKLRSHSAPKQRPVETLGRQKSRRRSSYVSKVVQMQ